MNAFWMALQLLSTLPTPRQTHDQDQNSAASILFYPLVGLVLGTLLWSAHALLTQVLGTLPYADMLNAALLLGLWIALTGALHLDGLADCADAWLGGLGDREKTLRILKDPYSGPVAVTTLVLLFLLKWLCLVILVNQQQTLMLLLVLSLSRAGLLVFFIRLPYARANGIATAMADKVPKKKALCLLISLTLALTLLHWHILLAVALLALLFFCFESALKQRLGGFTGDTLGAWVECAELLLLLWAVFNPLAP